MKVFDDVDYRRTQSGSHQDECNKAGDTGSPEVQVAILSERINNSPAFQIPREGQSFASRAFENGRHTPLTS